MHKGRQIPAVPLDMPMSDVLKEISSKRLGMTCVVDNENKPIGIITDGDLRRQLEKFGKNLLFKTAAECMTPSPIAIDKDDLAAKALHVMEENKVTSLIVKNKEGGIEGIIHLHDLWRTELF